MPLDPATTPQLVCALAEATHADPGADKLLVARVHRTARDLLGALAARGVDTAGWEVAGARDLAQKLVAREMQEAGLREADDLDQEALLDKALDRALGEVGGPWSVLAEGPGFRTAAQEALRTLRIAGVTADGLAGVALADAVKGRLLARALAEYEELLAERSLADPAKVFDRAIRAMEAGRLVSAARVYLVPGHRLRGLTGRFIAGLRDRRAEVLACDPTSGIEPDGTTLWRAGGAAHPLCALHAPRPGEPTDGLSLFAAASARDELREVLRQARALGLGWDEVEVIAADPSYPALLDGLARRLGVPVRYAVGLPAVRTRSGRVVAEHLAALETAYVGRTSSAAEVARIAAEFLDTLPADAVRDRLLGRATRIAQVLTRPLPWDLAVRNVRGRLGLLVAATTEREEEEGEGNGIGKRGAGELLISEIQHGGRSGRAATFVVGLSAEVFPGTGLQDPLLLDDDRRRIGAALPEAASGLPTSAELLAERRHTLAATLAGLRGRVSISYPAWHPGEARTVAPSSVVLQAFRVATGDADTDYQALTEHLGSLRGAVPRGSTHLDRADHWLAELRGKAAAIPGDGLARVRAAFPGLAAGLRAMAARSAPEASPFLGIVRSRPERFDPRHNAELVVSASALEMLGTCPHKYLIRYVLGVKVPRGIAGDDAWLGPDGRGTVLHDAYEGALLRARATGFDPRGDPSDGRLLEAALEALDDAAAKMRTSQPPPNEAVFAHEVQALRRELRVWVASWADEPAEWLEVELDFGPRERHQYPAVPIDLRGGTIRVEGSVDRVDRLPDGTLRIVDYKTGGRTKYEARSGTFSGGRRLQHFIYARAAEAILQAPVSRMEYRFPTDRGENDRRGYLRAQFEPAAGLIADLLDLAAAGHFVPTDDPKDCGFCDFAHVCGASVDDYGKVLASPPADWGRERAAEAHPHYAPLLRARAIEQ